MNVLNIDYHKIPEDLVPSSACIGFFDGIHKGHQELLKEAVNEAVSSGLEAALITFNPDPSEVLQTGSDPSHLTSIPQRIAIAEQLGIRTIYLISFTKELAALQPEEFIDQVLKPLKIWHLVCGFDFTFGKYGKGKAEDLEQVPDFSVKIIPAVCDQGEKISSTRIEKAVREGDMETAGRLLGRPYTMSGTVIKGRQKGRMIGYPTANIQTDTIYVLPPCGVYEGFAEVKGEEYLCMINLGHNSRFNYYEKLSFEVHLLDFEGDLYGCPIEIRWGTKIRDEMVFADLEALKLQLQADEKTIRGHFKSLPNMVR